MNRSEKLMTNRMTQATNDIIEKKNTIIKTHVEESIKLGAYLTDLLGPVDEIDALASLLGMARRVEDQDRFDYTIETLDHIVLRRIRALARRCRNDLAAWDRGDRHGPKLREKDYDEAPHC